MQRLEVSGAVRPIYGLLGVKRLIKISPVTGLEWPRDFQEVEVPRFHDNGTGRW